MAYTITLEHSSVRPPRVVLHRDGIASVFEAYEGLLQMHPEAHPRPEDRLDFPPEQYHQLTYTIRNATGQVVKHGYWRQMKGWDQIRTVDDEAQYLVDYRTDPEETLGDLLRRFLDEFLERQSVDDHYLPSLGAYSLAALRTLYDLALRAADDPINFMGVTSTIFLEASRVRDHGTLWPRYVLRVLARGDGPRWIAQHDAQALDLLNKTEALYNSLLLGRSFDLNTWQDVLQEAKAAKAARKDLLIKGLSDVYEIMIYAIEVYAARTYRAEPSGHYGAANFVLAARMIRKSVSGRTWPPADALDEFLDEMRLSPLLPSS